MKILVTPTSFSKPVNDEARKKLEAFADEVVYNKFGRPLEPQKVSEMLAGVGLDAYETEPVTDSPLLGQQNVVMTPHTGAHTNEAISGMGMMSVRNLIAVMSGEDCKYVVGK